MLHDANGLPRHSALPQPYANISELNFSKASFVVAHRRIRFRLFGLSIAITTCSRDNIKKHSKIDAIIAQRGIKFITAARTGRSASTLRLMPLPAAYKTHEHVLKSYFRIPDCS
jgi:hypothetical protein